MQEFAMVFEPPPLGDERTARGAPAPAAARPASDDERTLPGGMPADDDLDSVPDLGEPAANSAFAHHPLPYGTLIEGFRITGLIGEGGFGVVYRAWDDALERHVAIKEYMPETLAVRGRTSFDVSVRSERHRGTFEAGLKSFVNEARLLARFDHPALVKVLRFWEANHTAYMAMPYYEGPTLKTALDVLGSPPPEETLRDWLLPMLDALSVLHRQNYYHRDIAPDNILLTGAGPLLLDFGAARHVISDMTKTITVVLKPGYAPIEQYGGDTFQGAWTDLYALAGVVRYAITGKTPTPSVERIVNDKLEPLAKTHAGRYSDGFLRAIDTALAVRPEDRPQDVAEFRELLNAGLPANSPLRFRAAGFQHSSFQDDLSTQAFERRPGVAKPAAPVAPETGATVVQLRPATAAGRMLRRLGKLAYALATVGLLTVGAAVWWVKVREVREPVAAPAKASTAPAPAAVQPTPVPASKPPAPAPVAAPAKSSATPAPAPALSPPVPAPLAAPAPVSKVIAAPAPAPRPAPVIEPVPTPPPASVVVPIPMVPTPPVVPAPAPAPAPATSSTPAPAPAAPAAEGTDAMAVPWKAPEAVAVPRPRPAPRASTERPAAERPARPVASARVEPEAASPPPQQAESPATPKERARPGRCSDIVAKASLEPLSSEEAAYLRRECR